MDSNALKAEATNDNNSFETIKHMVAAVNDTDPAKDSNAIAFMKK